MKHIHVHVDRPRGAGKTSDCGCGGHTVDAPGAGMSAQGRKVDLKPSPPLTSIRTHGPAGGNIAHHREKSKHHAKVAEDTDESEDELRNMHTACSNSHAMAAHYLNVAQHHEGGGEGMTNAQRHANIAGHHEARIRSHKPKEKTKDVATTDDWAKWNEEHKNTAALHRKIAARKGEKHPDHPFHLAAAKHHETAAEHMAAKNKAGAEASHKLAKAHENRINKGRGSDPQGEAKRQNSQMLSPKSSEFREAVEAFHAKHDKKPSKK